MDRALLYALVGIGAVAVPLVKKFLDDRESKIEHQAATEALRSLTADQAMSLYSQKLLDEQQEMKRAKAEAAIQAAIRKATRE